MKAQRTISRLSFGLAVLLVIVVLTWGENHLGWFVLSRIGVANGDSPPIGLGLLLLNLILARSAVDRGFKAMGLSRSGRIVEGRRPASTIAEFVPGETIEVRCRSTLSNGLALTGLGMAAFVFLLAEVILPPQAMTGREWLPALYGMFLGLGVLCYLMRFIKIIRIDADGVTAYRKGYSILPTKIPWARIASCDLVALRDPFGKVVLTYPVMKDEAGKDLFLGLIQGFAYASAQDQQRVLLSLKQRFPKLDVAPWEL